LAGWTVFADSNSDGVLDPGEISATSDSKGNYVLTLVAGSYQVREIVGSGFRATEPHTAVYDVTLSPGQEAVRFFGNTTLTLISGYVFLDSDRDGNRDPGEKGLAGWRVFNDVDGDGFWDANEAIVRTDKNGKYRFGTLAAGTHRIQVFMQTNWVATVPGSGARKVTVGSGGTTSNKNFGVMPIV
jgi:hypothetical protein